MKPLQGIRIVEFATVGGIPFCAWMLSQHGATVTRICSPQPRELGVSVSSNGNISEWNRQNVILDLKSPDGRETALALIEMADALIEGFRPGVMERLGLGPKDCHERNPRLIYGRLVGWNRKGKWAQSAGHDINYIAMAGVLNSSGPDSIPINLIGDIAGGALYLSFGIAAALHARAVTGKGSVVDTAMTDGSLHMLSAVFGRHAVGAWNDGAASNVIDGGVPWYRTYATADGRYIAVGAIEERFYNNFVRTMGIELGELPPRTDHSRWPELESVFAAKFLGGTMEEWAIRFEGVDACVTPVLTLVETKSNDLTKDAFTTQSGITLPKPVPDFQIT
jgi:alpha-methylacyl-CoA racemase